MVESATKTADFVRRKNGRTQHAAARELEQRFRDSSMVEHAAVNRRVAGSSPARGAKGTRCANLPTWFSFFMSQRVSLNKQS